MSITFELSHFVGAPPERVFRALTDLDAASVWMPNLVGIEKLFEGEVKVGSEWRETRKMFGKEATEQFEVTELEPPRRVGLRVDGTKGSSRKGEYLFRYDLHPRDGGTDVRLHTEIRGQGRVGMLIGKLLKGAFKSAVAKDLHAMGAHLERAPLTS
ncbi:MAG TPA: SRPBCC family protein [Longimicrobiaceae bacterium]|nr:SRPBCC family protein [Longimicrobiaceae bacterium]